MFADHSTSGIEYEQFAASASRAVWTIGLVREPAARCLSSFYHLHVARAGLEPSAAALVRFAEAQCADRLWHYYRRAPHIDLLAETERFDESLVALAWALDLSLGDLLYVAAKDSRLRAAQHQVVPQHLQPAEVRTLFSSARFLAANARDRELWRLAAECLDAAAALLGRERAAEARELLRFHLATVQRRWSSFSPRWTAVSCLYRDNGCHLRCFNAYASERAGTRAGYKLRWRTGQSCRPYQAWWLKTRIMLMFKKKKKKKKRKKKIKDKRKPKWVSL